MKKAICGFIARVLGLLPDGSLHNLMIEVLREKELTFVLEHDNRLYTLIGQKNPYHKDQIIHYTEFFYMHTHPESKVLDVGCGSGIVSYKLATARGCKVHSIDIEDKRTWKHENVTFELQNMWAYNSPEEYDTVILSNVLEHSTDRVNLLKHLRMMTLCCQFLIRVPMRDRHWVVKLKELCGVDCRLDPDHEVEYTFSLFESEIRKAGFYIHDYEIKWGELYAVVE